MAEVIKEEDMEYSSPTVITRRTDCEDVVNIDLTNEESPTIMETLV